MMVKILHVQLQGASMSTERSRLLVLGTGFAGIGVMKGLRKLDLLEKLDVTFVSATGIFEYLPSAPELVSGKVTPDKISRTLSLPMKSLGVNLIKGRVSSIDLNSKRVLLESEESLDYDYIAICLGARPWLPPGGLPDNAVTTYRVADTLKFRTLLEKASGRVLVVGAGLTGVEVAGEIVDLARERGLDIEITIVEKLPRAAPCMGNKRAGRLAKEFLEKRGVKFILGKGVEQVEEGKAILEGGETLEFSAAAWTAGVVPPEPIESLPREHRKGRFLAVDAHLRVPGAEGAYAAGDCVHLEIGGKWAAKMAEEAIFQGELIAENVWREIKGEPLKSHRIRFSVQSPRCLVSLGADRAVLAYGTKLAFLGRFPYILKKRIERKFMAELDHLLKDH